MSDFVIRIGPDGNIDPEKKGDNIYYVYAHINQETKKVFYIGMGKNKRAWSKNRHPYWTKYVEKLNCKYDVKILKDKLYEQEAVEWEQHYMREYANTLLNIQNWYQPHPGWEIYDHYHNKQYEIDNKMIILRNWELVDINRAIDGYKELLHTHEELRKLSPRQYEGELIQELSEEQGPYYIINKLSICLARVGKVKEAIKIIEEYLSKFPMDRELSGSSKVFDTLEKRLDRFRKGKTIAKAKKKQIIKPILDKSTWVFNGYQLTISKRNIHLLRSEQENWWEGILRLKKKGDHNKVIDICLAHLEEPSSFVDVASILRTEIESHQDDISKMEIYLKKLYALAVYYSVLNRKRLYNTEKEISSKLQLDRRMEYCYDEIGYIYLRLLKQKDITILIKYLGEPDKHTEPIFPYDKLSSSEKKMIGQNFFC